MQIFWRGFLVLSCLLVAGCASNLARDHGKRQDITQPIVAGASQGPQLRVALILPITGNNAGLGKAMQNAAILANYDIHNHDVTLIPLDQSNVMQNPQSLLDSQINVIIGPLTADATRRLAPFARQNHMRMFSLSNDPSLPDDNTVVFGYRVEGEVTRILNYASTRGKNHILAVVPKDAYGDAVAAAIPTNVQIIRFGRTDELAAALKNISPAPDAVFIPVSGENLSPVLKTLADAGLAHNQVQYLSTGLWDDAGIWQMPELDGAWYPAADPKQLQLYLERYRAQYGNQPPRLSALSYNAVAMISILDRQNALDPFTPSQLNNPNGFNGVDGLFRILPDGSVRRALAVVEIQNRAPSVIQAAPDSTALVQ